MRRPSSFFASERAMRCFVAASATMSLRFEIEFRVALQIRASNVRETKCSISEVHISGMS